MIDDGLGCWIRDLRDRVARGELYGHPPIDIGDGTGALPAERTIRIMLAELDDLDDPEGIWRLDGGRAGRRCALLDDFRRLRALLG